MAVARAQNSKDTRRRSLLPQLTHRNETNLTAASEGEDRHNSQEYTDSVDLISQGTVTANESRKILMPPPPNTGRSRSSQIPAKSRGASRFSSSGSLRRSSTMIASKPYSVSTAARPRASSGLKMASTAPKPATHGRSFSQQAKHKPLRSPDEESKSTTATGSSPMTSQQPAFSSLQQHYSPRKGPNQMPPVPSKRLLQETNQDAATGSLHALHLELVQLHLMHQSAHKVQRQWEESANAHFQNRFDDLYARHVELREIAYEQQTMLNQIALVEWCQGIPSSQVAEKVRTLSRNIADLKALLEPEGKYAKVVEVFESWFKQAQGTQALRKSGDAQSKKKLTFIKGIGDGWKAEAMVLERELTYCSREINAFGDVSNDSSLGRILSLHKTFVANLLGELDVVQWIEGQTMGEEAVWMETTIQKLSSNIRDAVSM